MLEGQEVKSGAVGEVHPRVI